MIIPLHLLPESHHNAPIYFDLQAVDPSLRPQHSIELGSPIAGPVDAQDLQRLQQLMARENIALQPTRMLYDRLYAFERLALAHASANPALQDLALQMFHGYQQAGEWIGLIH